jgi:DNA polymerase-4
MQRLFGPNHGRRLHEYAHGIDHRPVAHDRRPQSISRRTSFDPPAGETAFLTAMLDYLLERAASWMRYQGLAARLVKVFFSYNDNQWADGQERLPRPTQRDDLLREAARDRFLRLYTRRLPLRLLGVELDALAPVLTQPELFADPGEKRRRRLAECKDAIRRRYGFTSLLSGNELTLTNRLPHDRENLKLRTPCLTR